jgi:hypothetical protein
MSKRRYDDAGACEEQAVQAEGQLDYRVDFCAAECPSGRTSFGESS